MGADEEVIERVYHVGDLSRPRRRPAASLEGSGLSVSLHPEEWRKIARLGDAPVYELVKPGARFLVWSEQSERRALEWSVREGYLERAVVYRVCRWDDELDDELCVDFRDRAAAVREAADLEPEAAVEQVPGYVLGPRGRAYWRDAFASEPDDDLARGLALVFHAEALGLDGAWWHELLDPARLSAPRGVVFPGSLPTWRVREVEHERVLNALRESLLPPG